MDHARFLVLEDEPKAARHLARLVRPHGIPIVAASVEEALRALADPGPWSALLLDAGLPDGSGLDVLAQERKVRPTTPALVLTGDTKRETINTACKLGAAYLVKPISAEAIERFLVDASAAGLTVRVSRIVKAWAKRYGLSEAEEDVLRGAALGESREDTAARRNASVFTVKRQITSILTRTRDSSLEAAVARLLREVAGVA